MQAHLVSLEANVQYKSEDSSVSVRHGYNIIIINLNIF